MKLRQLFFIVVLLFGATSVPTAQESIHLRFELVKNGSVVAAPEVSGMTGSTGSIRLAGVGSIEFTPTLRGSDSLAIAFDIQSASRRLRPRLVISGTQPGSVSWTSDKDAESFRITVSWIR
jgi:hypothetical protein